MLDQTRWPELHDVACWLARPVERQLAVLDAIAGASGRERRAFLSDPEPQRFRPGGPRLAHRRSGLRCCLVPGGLARLGSSDATRTVSIAPFLLAEEPLSSDDGLRFGVGGWRRTRFLPAEGGVLYLEADEIERMTLPPLRLPTDDEWEAAWRAGTTTTFFWGEEVPAAPPALPHLLGLAMPGWWDEATAGGRVRGGAARLWPWRDDEGLQRLRPEFARTLADDLAPHSLALRLALSLAALDDYGDVSDLTTSAAPR